MKHAVKKSNSKVVLIILCVAVLVFGAVGGTLAWLIAESNEVVNTFTYGDINIKLEESVSDNDPDNNPNTNTYVMMPGHKLAKDPEVTVLKGSEDSYLFVKLTKSANFDTFLTYTVADGWNKLDIQGATNYEVWYREVSKLDASGAENDDQAFRVLAGVAGDAELENGYVTVKDTVGKADIDGLKTSGELPTLSIKAYAVQRDENITSAAQAWDLAVAQESASQNP